MAPVSEDPKPTGMPAQEAKQDNAGNEGKMNLIINYLPQRLTDEQFRTIFTAIGPIKASKIVRHKETGRSYGYGFIDYRDAGDAAYAIESLNGLLVMDKTIKVSYARPVGEAIKHAKLYVRGIPEDYPLGQAKKIFADFGKLIQFRVIEDRSGAHKRVAYVLYDLRVNAEAAMGAPTGTTLPGATVPLVIKHAESNSSEREESGDRGAPRQLTSAPSGASGGGSKRQFHGWKRYRLPHGSHHYTVSVSPVRAVTAGPILFAYNLGTDTDERSLWRLIANYGNVINVNIVRDTATGLSMGYGLVTTATYQDCVSVIEALNGYRYAERPHRGSFKHRKFNDK